MTTSYREWKKRRKIFGIIIPIFGGGIVGLAFILGESEIEIAPYVVFAGILIALISWIGNMYIIVSGKTSHKNAPQINIGMTYDEVVNILGKPNEKEDVTKNKFTCMYRLEKKMITIENDKVVDVDFLETS